MSLCAECRKEAELTEKWRGKGFCSLICLRCYQAGFYEAERDFMNGEFVVQQIDAFFDKSD